MGMAMQMPMSKVIRHPTYKGCFYCQACHATYTPNLEWGFVSRDRNSTNPSDDRWWGIHRKGDECPSCGRKPEDIDGSATK